MAPCTECMQQIVKHDSPVQRDCWKILGWWCRLYVVYGRENSYAQKSPEWSFVRADCVKKEIAAERLLRARSTFSKSLAVCVKVGANAADIRRSCSEDQWRILPWCASHSTATACRAGDLGRLHLATRQCSSAPRTWHNQTSSNISITWFQPPYKYSWLWKIVIFDQSGSRRRFSY